MTKVHIKGGTFLVTGGFGFIGSRVTQHLLKGGAKKVIVYDNLVRGKISNIGLDVNHPNLVINKNGGDVREVDVLSDAMKDVDGVFHLAAMWLLHCKDFPRTAFDVNIQGTFNVLEACVKNNIKRLVLSSSASVYGDAINVPMQESHPLNNRNFYGATKIASEAMARAFYDRYGISFVGLRYMNVYGPNQDQNAAYNGIIPVLFNNLASGEITYINGDGSQSYDFIHVEDVAKCNLLAMEADVEDEFYNVGTGTGTKISELVETIFEVTQKKSPIKFQPYTAEDVRRLVQNRIGSTQKASKDLKFDYSINLKSGLEDLYKWRQGND